jgi:hypothetical protein
MTAISDQSFVTAIPQLTLSGSYKVKMRKSSPPLQMKGGCGDRVRSPEDGTDVEGRKWERGRSNF